MPHALEVTGLTKDQLAELESARNNLYALRDWPQMRIKWIAAIRAQEQILGMTPHSAFDKLKARDRIYERSRETVAALMPALTGPMATRK